MILQELMEELMEKKNVSMHIPTIDELKEMREFLINNDKKRNGLLNYVQAKKIEYTIINGGLENLTEKDVRLEETIPIFYPAELIYCDEFVRNNLSMFQAMANNARYKKEASPLDNLNYMGEDIKYTKDFIEMIVVMLNKTLRQNLSYRFENKHDSLVTSIIEGTLLSKINFPISDLLKDYLISIDPFYALYFKDEKTKFMKPSIAIKLFNSLDNYARRYKASHFFGHHEDLFDEHYSAARKLLKFIEEKNK